MVDYMNKLDFTNKLKEKLNLNDLECTKINSIIDDTFLIGRKNKEIIIQRFIKELDISIERANEIYNTIASILMGEIKVKLKHPFKNLDKK